MVVFVPALNGVNGLEFLRELRRYDVPVIALNRCSEITDRIVALELGADDCMAKPFDPRELVVRMNAIFRRRTELPDVGLPQLSLQVGRWTLQPNERRLIAPNGNWLALSASEYRLLMTFLRSPRVVLSRERLMSEAKGRKFQDSDRAIDLLVSRLRRKLEAESSRGSLIRTIRGEGYLFEPAPGAATHRRAAMAPVLQLELTSCPNARVVDRSSYVPRVAWA